jgi:anhydro-N-acetylmuramic acid kinase
MLIEKYNVIAVMSGTSLDGIDILYANFTFKKLWKFNIIEGKTYSYSPYWKEILSHLTQKSTKDLKRIDDEYSEYLAEKITSFIQSKQLKDIDFIASHGHTALHNPEEGVTYQIGNQQILADALCQKVVCDFRVQDVKLGGQGAPLVPIGDKLLFSKYSYCINLGGFANISYEEKGLRIAYDICPANIVLNYYAKELGLEYDDKGQIAEGGILNESLLQDLNSLNYYKKIPPKSLGLEWVQSIVFPVIKKHKLFPKDILRTVVEHVAIQVSKAIHSGNSSVFLTGGGAYNSFLIKRITYYSECKIEMPSNQIIEFKEALVFGLLGVLKVRNEVNCLRSVTGAQKDHSSGRILIPKNSV